MCDLKLGIFLVVVVIGLLFGLYRVVDADVKNDKRLMTACMADGHKEYACVGMIKGHGR